MNDIFGYLLIVALILGTPIGFVIWALCVALRARRDLRSLGDRVEALQHEIRLLKRGTQERPQTAVPFVSPDLGKDEPSWEVHHAPPTPISAPPFIPSEEVSQVPPPLPTPGEKFPEWTKEEASVSHEAKAFKINWEQFLGVKLFAWAGAVVGLLTVVFFVKYSFEHNLIGPEMRVAIGYLVGAGLLVGGLFLSRDKYAVLVQTLSATGVLILYADTFAAHAYYHLIASSAITFAVMILITAVAFLLAVRLNAAAVAVIAMAGGFVTPPLLSTGQDNPLGLFSYVALLNSGLAAVAFRQRWNFLILLGAIGTIVMQVGWVIKFFAVAKVFIAMAVFLGFGAFFVAVFLVAHRLNRVDPNVAAVGIIMPFVALGFALYLLWHPYPEIARQPMRLFSFVFFADIALLVMAWLRQETRSAHLFSGAAVFFILGYWTTSFLTINLMNWALGFYLLFAILHAVFPAVLNRLKADSNPQSWVHLFPAAGLLLVILTITKGLMPTWLVWPVVLVLDLAAIALAAATVSIFGILSVLILTMVVVGAWIMNVPSTLVGAAFMPTMLSVVGVFGLIFFGAGIWAATRIVPRLAGEGPGGRNQDWTSQFIGFKTPSELGALIPGLSAFLPFVLLIMLIEQLPLNDPSPVFGLSLLMIVLLLAAALRFEVDSLSLIGLGCVLAVEHVWWLKRYSPEQAYVLLGWNIGFFVLFSIYPFLFQTKFRERMTPWVSASLSGPGHFYLVYKVMTQTFHNPYMGLVPAVFAIPSLAGLFRLIRTIPSESAHRNTQLAWFGGVTLFFITLIFPIQFEKQWITVGWALEGAALLWLFHRVPHHGLRLLGTVLLAISFGRLVLNPSVFQYHPRSEQVILNWYFYTYGIVTACLFVGGRLLAPPHNIVAGRNAQPLLYALGGILGFCLLNIEIADYFSTGRVLTFQFSGNTARDMTYSLAWAVYAMMVLAIGFKAKNSAARYAGLGLLVITLFKLFFHDLWRLGGLYRISSFLGMAITLFLVSFVYQKFLATERSTLQEKPTAS